MTEISESPSGKQDLDTMRYFIQSRESKLRKLQKRFKIDIARGKEELEKANENIAKLTKDVEKYKEINLKMKEEHAFQLQTFQARHEQRIQRSKQDLNMIIGEFNEKTAELVTERLNVAHQQEIAKITQFYQERFRLIKDEYENELQAKEDENEALKEQIHESIFNGSERTSQTYKFSLGKDDDKTHFFHVRELEDQLEEQRLIIESQQRIIEDLSRELKSNFQRTPSRAKNYEKAHKRKNSEKSLQTLLDQLS